MLKIYDKDHNAIGHIVKYKDCKIESEVDTGDKTLSFTYLAKHHNLTNEMYVRMKEDEYVIKEVPATTGSFPQIVAVLNLEELQKDMWQTFSVTDTTIDEAVRPVLAGTGWTVGYCDVTKKRNAGMMQVSSLDVIRNLCMAFMCEPVFDTIQKTVSFYARRGEDKGVYFLAGLNLEKLQRKSTSYDYYTRIIPIGQDGLTIESVNDGKNYLENFQYSDKVLTYIWKDESYTDPQALKEDAELKLEDLSKPTVSYSVDVRDLAAQKPEYSILSYAEGDTVKLIDQETGTMVSQRIKKLVRYPDNPEKNTCEIANTFLTFEEIQQKYQDAANIINYTVTGEGRYTGTINVSDILKFEQGIAGSATIGNINSSIVSMQGDLGQVKLALGQVETNYLKAEEADLKYATIENLNVVNQNVHSIQGDYASFKSSVTDELAAHTASIDYLTTHNVTTDYLEANYAAIDLANIEQGCITTAMLGTGIVGTAQIADGSITDAKIVELTANKITAGTLSVERLEIRGSTNSLVYALNDITGALQAQNVDTLNGEILTPRTITADKIVANAITSNEIAAKTITANNIAANSITGNEIVANSITGNEIAANSIKATNIDTLDLFAQDITATGTIRGVDLIGATGSFSGSIVSTSGSIGGWSLGEYCIYAENIPDALNTSTTVVLQNLGYSLFNAVNCTGTNCDVTVEEKQITVVPSQSGSATLHAHIPISKGKYIINIASGYAKSGKRDDQITGSYQYSETDENGDTMYNIVNIIFEKNSSISGIQTEYSFEFEIEHDTNDFEIEYTMPSAVQGETYIFSVNAAKNGEVYDPALPVVNGIPSGAILAIKKTSENGTITVPFYIASSGLLNAHGGICLNSTPGAWITGKTATNCIYNSANQSSSSYHPIMRINSSSGHVWNIGGLANAVGFYGYYASRTNNGYDWSTTWDTGTGILTHSNDFKVNGAIYEGGTALSNKYIPKTASCNKNWNWSGQGGQPTWVWGGNDVTNMYVYNPSNFSVNYANTAGYANSVAAHEHNGLTVRNSGVELYGSTPFIDFHCGNSTADYTSRIIEWKSGELSINSFTFSGQVIMNASGCVLSTSAASAGLYGTEKVFRTSMANDGKIALGGSAARWSKVYAASATISTSDERDKNIIGVLDERHKKLFMKLKPIVFQWRDRESDTCVHFGLGAQTTEQAARECGIIDGEIAAIQHDYWDEPNPKDGRTDRYGMAYEEISMLVIPVVQEHELRLTAAENDLKAYSIDLSAQSVRLACLETREETTEYRLSEALRKISEQDIKISQQAAEIEYLKNHLQAIA